MERSEAHMIRQINTATVRTTLPAMWVTLITWVVVRLGWEPSADDWQVIMLLGPVILSVAYRAGREVEARWPAIGRIIFGSSATPRYDD
jgi:hypothetical protein